MKLKSEYIFIVILGVLLIGSIIFGGSQYSFNKQKEKEIKELRKIAEKSKDVAISKIDTMVIYIDSAKIQDKKNQEVHKKVIAKKNEIKQNTQAIDTFSRNANLEYFHVGARYYRSQED
jgi:hypothetical protein